MVKDLRTEHETGNVDGVLDGDLDPFMEAYLRWHAGPAATPEAPLTRPWGPRRRAGSAGSVAGSRTRLGRPRRLARSRLHDQARKRHQGLQGRRRRPARRQRRHPEGRVRLPRRAVGLGQVDLHPPAEQGGGARPRAASSWPARTSASSRAGRCRTCAATSAASSRTSSCCPNKTVVRERGVRPRGHRPARARHQDPGARRSSSWSACRRRSTNLPDELSGGEQQRVSIARAFVNRPLILLADEPTGNLDPATSVGIMRLLDRINRTGTTVVMATHDRGIVDTMRRRVIELDRGIDRPRPGPRRLRVGTRPDHGPQARLRRPRDGVQPRGATSRSRSPRC